MIYLKLNGEGILKNITGFDALYMDQHNDSIISKIYGSKFRILFNSGNYFRVEYDKIKIRFFQELASEIEDAIKRGENSVIPVYLIIARVARRWEST